MNSALIEQYKKDDSQELELRFKDITRAAFESIFASAREKHGEPKIELSVNIISKNVTGKTIRDDGQYIRRIVFDQSTPISDTYHYKNRVLRQISHDNSFLRYNVDLSTEKDITKFATSRDAMVRFKARCSFGIPVGAAQWRLDMTLVKQATLGDLESSMKTVRDNMFKSLTADNFIARASSQGFARMTTNTGSSTSPGQTLGRSTSQFEVELEHISGEPVPADAASAVFILANPKYLTEISYQEEINHIAAFIGAESNHRSIFRLKQLGNQVIAINKTSYYAELFPPVGMYLTPKLDGERVIVSVRGGRARVMKSDSFEEILPTKSSAKSDLKNSSKQDSSSTNDPAEVVHPATIVDGELLDGTVHIFDVIAVSGENISRLTFEQRYEKAESAAEIVSEYIPAVVKPVRVIVEPHKDIKAVWDAAGGDSAVELSMAKDDNTKSTKSKDTKSVKPVDGLIFIRPGSNYKETQNYKWKPYRLNTIDFLVIDCPAKLRGIAPYISKAKNLYLLLVGINKPLYDKLGLERLPYLPQYSGYFPVQFSPSMNPLAYIWHSDLPDLNMKIVELARNDDNTEWVFNKVREDRKIEENYFGNDFKIAELTYANYVDRFELSDLWKPTSYFTKNASDIYLAGNKLRRYCIHVLLKNNLVNANRIIDAAAGRGADIGRYQQIGVANALFIDIDASAIAELVRRKFTTDKRPPRINRRDQDGAHGGRQAYDGNEMTSQVDRFLTTPSQVDRFRGAVNDTRIRGGSIRPTVEKRSMVVHTLVADLKTKNDELIAATYQYGYSPNTVDGVVCNFALHYMCDTIDNLRNMLIFVSKMLKVGGVFIFTVMDGAAVFELLRGMETGQQWEVRENVIKYAIKKEFVGDKLTPAGQMISVKLPFSDEMYKEPLCNVDVVIAEAKKLKLELEVNSSMTEYLEGFTRVNASLADRLTPDDKKYISLHRGVTMRRVK